MPKWVVMFEVYDADELMTTGSTEVEAKDGEDARWLARRNLSSDWKEEINLELVAIYGPYKDAK